MVGADDAACAIARAVSAEKLAFLTDVKGVYQDPEDKNSLISELSVSEAQQLIGNGNIVLPFYTKRTSTAIISVR